MEPCIQPLACPVCDAPLSQVAQTLQCLRGHSYDIAREGYINLLLGHKKPKIQGDTRSMLAARRQFLDAGHYTPLADAINQLVANQIHHDDRPVIVDAGCGEGYYLRRMHTYLEAEGLAANVCSFGVDISRDAARMAAGLAPQVRFVVADVNRRLPFADGRVTLLLNTFAPRHVAEFDRILSEDGRIIVVIPSPNHLIELHSALNLLGVEEKKQQHVKDQFQSFNMVEAITLAYPLALNNADLLTLLQMTPNDWHFSDEDWEAARNLGDVETTAAFNIMLFRRQSQRET